ncbi:MAG: RnfH family protein [Pseudomonadota bacterium]|nr:RnfH family protein [Pseudomonadota bacterium]
MTLDLPHGATAAEALSAVATLRGAAVEPGATLSIGIWGRRCPPSTLLADGDRVELYRPLAQSAVEARRQRARQRRVAKSSSKNVGGECDPEKLGSP